jgi:hypothetical protein
MSEPVDTRELWLDVVDRMYDVLGLENLTDEQTNWLVDHIEVPVRALVCQLEGHKVVDDQCGIPEHRYCLICGDRQPNAEVNA